MSIGSRIVARVFRLPRAETHRVKVERDIKIPMPDGIQLLADRYYPRGKRKLPTVLVRCPYGRKGLAGIIYGRLLAEHGFQALLQSCRGTCGSGGRFDPLGQESEDGLATIAWMKKQEWFSGVFGMTGASFLGYTQWGVAADAGPELKAMAPQVTAARHLGMIYPGGSFSLALALDLLYTWEREKLSAGSGKVSDLLASSSRARRLRDASNHFPLKDADELVLGHQVDYFQTMLEHASHPEFQEPMDYSSMVSRVSVPVNLVSGWYDVHLTGLLDDYARLRSAGREPYLMIGPWRHTSMTGMGAGVRDSLSWLKAHLLNNRTDLRDAPVRVFIMGSEEWRDFPAWPPPGYVPQRWHFSAGSRLTPQMPAASEPDKYRYDPADPTPSVGGVFLGSFLGSEASRQDNRALEARQDVIVYSSDRLDTNLEVVGPVQAELFVRSSLQHADFFVRLCDVDPSGKSLNVCDGIVRVRPGSPTPDTDGTLRVLVDLYPTGYCFRRGHSVRVQVSSGAHPRFARNLGTGEPLDTGVDMRAADQTVYHDPAHPSAVILPVST